MILILLASLILLCSAMPGYCQQTSKELFEQAEHVYDNVPVLPGGDMIAGFSLSGLIGGMFFAGIGFVAFVYGKRNARLKPLVIGIFLMGYPYFVKDTAAIYVTGAVLSTLLYLFRE